MALKRFLLFAGADYYPGGGWNDFESSHDTQEEARAEAERLQSNNGDWTQIVDSQTGEIVQPRTATDPPPLPKWPNRFTADYLEDKS